MASQLFKQTGTISIIPIRSHVKKRQIPPKLIKRIESQIKHCDSSFNHTIFLKDWKSDVKLKKNVVDEQYDIDEKSVHEAATYNALVVGSENYNQQYPYIAYQNLTNIYNTVHRRMQRTQWDVPPSLRSAIGCNISTPVTFKDQLSSHIDGNHDTSKHKKHKKKKQKSSSQQSHDENSRLLPVIFTRNELSDSNLLHLKDGTDQSNMPYFVNSDHGVEVIIYRDIASNMKSRRRIQRLLDQFEPDTIITEYNVRNFQQFRNSASWKHALASSLQYVVPSVADLHLRFAPNIQPQSHAVSAMIQTLDAGGNKNEMNVIAGGLCDDYHSLLSEYAYLCDLFSLSAIEISPILPVKIVPKKVKILTEKLLKANTTFSSEMRYLIQPYFWPHSHLYGQMRNAYLMHCLYGCVQESKAQRIVLIVQDDNVMDLTVKLQSSEQSGFYLKYSYASLLKEVDQQFVTMPSVLPTTYLRNASIKLQDFEWKRLHSMFGLKFVEFLEHEMQMKQALVTK